ncbi:MAG: alpha/beta hydrolase fold domain-containing protein [Phycisphaeraceae bacterium]|nr:alpha/beta hydrolase fold domain-containing protein [Phycisphaeraceae bacterium]
MTALALEPDRTVVYKTVDEVELKLWIFEPEDHAADDAVPAIVFFFGGGWNGGTPRQFVPHADYFARRGMVAMAAEYRVKNPHGVSPAECVKDAVSAMRYVRAHAEEMGIDPDRIAAGGGSAGGHLAAATATVTGFEEADEDETVSYVPDALVLFNPVFDNGPGGYGHERVKDYWEPFSPLHNIERGIPPSITFLGREDHLIPVSVVEKWQEKVEAVEGRADIHFYDDAGHGFFNKSRDKGRYFRDTVEKADRFLASLGWLEGDPTVNGERQE